MLPLVQRLRRLVVDPFCYWGTTTITTVKLLILDPSVDFLLLSDSESMSFVLVLLFDAIVYTFFFQKKSNTILLLHLLLYDKSGEERLLRKGLRKSILLLLPLFLNRSQSRNQNFGETEKEYAIEAIIMGNSPSFN